MVRIKLNTTGGSRIRGTKYNFAKWGNSCKIKKWKDIRNETYNP